MSPVNSSASTRSHAENRPGIEAAIDLCQAGSDGICCRCEAEIEAERLRADPATPFCTACTRET